MITTQTVFVVGAGASVPYGLPTGADLRTEVIQEGSREDAKEIYRPLISEPLSIIGLREALEATGPLSVDAIIEHLPNLLEAGKAAMSRVLLAREGHEDLFRSGSDWIGYLFQYMAAPLDEFARNSVGFVTFNYDRLIEHKLTVALARLHGTSYAKAWEQVRQLPIVHVYGQLGEYSPEPNGTGLAVWKESFSGDRLSPPRVREAASGIRLIHERGGELQSVTEARKLLRFAKRVVFLGFGFDDNNVERIGADMYEVRSHALDPIYGSAYEMAPGEMIRAMDNVNKHFGLVAKVEGGISSFTGVKRDQIRLFDQDCLGTLRQVAHLLR